MTIRNNGIVRFLQVRLDTRLAYFLSTEIETGLEEDKKYSEAVGRKIKEYCWNSIAKGY